MTGDWKPVGYSGNIKVGDVVEFDVLRKDRFVRWRGKVLGVRNLGIGREEYIIKRDKLSVDGLKSDGLKHELIRVNDHPNHRLNFDNNWVYNYASYKYYEEEEGRTPVLFEGVPYKVELIQEVER